MRINELTRLVDSSTAETSKESSSSTLSLDEKDEIGIVSSDTDNVVSNHSRVAFALPNYAQVDPAASQFAFRLALLLTISALLVLIRTDSWYYPDAMWVLVSVLFVSWFPSLDAASVIEKIMQRVLGTFIGAILGLGCGFFCIGTFQTSMAQALFLLFCMFIFNYGIVLWAGQNKIGQTTVIRQYPYATILCVLTFSVCMLPFGLDEDPKWGHGVWRVCNVVVGCVLGALGAIVICPKSTAAVLHGKTARQVKLCGEASEAVLHLAAEHFGDKIEIQPLADELIEAPLETTVRWDTQRAENSWMREDTVTCKNADVALKKYEDAISDWTASKMLFPLLRFDPFHLNFGKAEQYAARKAYYREIARTLARSLRIQTTIVMLDGMIRNDTDFEFDDSELLMFTEIGSSVRRLLTIPLEPSKSNEAAITLLSNLNIIRKKIRQLSEAVSKPDKEDVAARNEGMLKYRAVLLLDDDENFETNDDAGREIPNFASDSHDNSLLFLQLVEHLILRSLRLFQAWKHVGLQAAKVEDKALHTLVSQAKGSGSKTSVN